MLSDRMKGISMFSSAGIAETYLESLNIDILLANELLEERARYYAHFYPKAEMIVGDIQDSNVYDTYLMKAKAINPSFLLATPPCQGMSTLGKKDYATDERNFLIFVTLKVIDALDLDVIVIENVPKFFDLYFPYKGRFLKIVDIIKEKYGRTYAVHAHIVNAKDYGVPQSRPRAVIILHKPNYEWKMPPTEKEITLREAIGYLPSLKNGEKSSIPYHYALQHSDMQVECMAHTMEGCSAMKNAIYYPKKIDGRKVSGFHNTYKRMKWEAPCPARTTNSGMISGHNNVHPGRLLPDGTVSDARALSLLELFIVSSLPKDWNLPKDYKDSFVRTIIGEAIPPLLLKKILMPLKMRNIDFGNIDRSDKKNKWTIMKYVAKFSLIVEYADLIRELKFKVDEETVKRINSIMKELHLYAPLNGKPSIDTTSFKICQIVYLMFAYRSADKKRIVFSPLGNLLLDNKDNKEKVGKIFATMLSKLPFNHPYNKMSAAFNIFPFRLLFKLLTDTRLDGKLYADEVFYLIAWTKEIDAVSYEDLVAEIRYFRLLHTDVKVDLFTKRLPVQDCLANVLHETEYLFTQLADANIVNHVDGDEVCALCHGGFGRGRIPDSLEEIGGVTNYKPTGRRAYRKDYISLQPYINSYVVKLLDECAFDEKPHSIYEELGTDDYILHLYNFYPNILLDELGLPHQKRIDFMSRLTNDIKKYSHNTVVGDCYRFENILCDAFNEFVDVEATTIAKAGTTDVECMYLTINEKFDVEAKSTMNKLSGVNAGRLREHRRKIGSKYTIVVTPNYVPSVISDIENSDNVLLTAPSLSNFLYQSAIKNRGNVSYKPIYDIIQSHKGEDISRFVTDYVATTYGIGQ